MYRVQFWKGHSFPYVWNFQCSQCSCRFATAFCLKLHETIHRSLSNPLTQRQKRYRCHKCGKHFGELANFVFHRTLHEQPKRRKSITKSEPKNSDSNRAPKETHDVKIENNFEGCTFKIERTCDSPTTREFSDSGETITLPREIILTVEDDSVFVITELKEGDFEHDQQNQVEVQFKVEEDKNQLKCSRCSETFTGTEALKLHMRSCTKVHTCSFCGKNLSSRKILREHELKHKGQCPYVCDICGNTFGRQDSLRKHKRVHLGIKKYVCDECGKVFTESGSLGKHKRIHSGSKPFVCQICGRGFVQSGQLATHKRTHTGEKPFPCNRCNYRFTTQSSLSRHLRAHDGIKRFKCPLCKGMTFLTKEGLENHFIMHNEESLYTCTICKRTFAREQNLTNHMKLHENTKRERILCQICEKSFSDETSLRRHHRRCHQVRPYSCETCGKKFVDTHSLTRHSATHTSTTSTTSTI